MDRARAILVHASGMADPRSDPAFWEDWKVWILESERLLPVGVTLSSKSKTLRYELCWCMCQAWQTHAATPPSGGLEGVLPLCCMPRMIETYQNPSLAARSCTRTPSMCWRALQASDPAGSSHGPETIRICKL